MPNNNITPVTTTTTEAEAVVATEEAGADDSYIATVQLSHRFQQTQIDDDAIQEEDPEVGPFGSSVAQAHVHTEDATSAVLAQQHSAVMEEVLEDDSEEDVDVDGGTSTRQLNFSHRRAEFSSVTFHRATPEVALGIVMNDDTPTTIASIIEGSLASDSPLRPGDVLVSVNGKVCRTMTGPDVAELLAHSVGSVHVVVHTPGGVSEFVESMVMKATPNERVGLAVRGDRTRHQLIISAIRRGHKFHESLLNQGDIVLSINGHAGAPLTPAKAAQLMKQAPVRVTILAKTLHETGAVVAQVSSRHLAHSSVRMVLPSTAGTHNYNGRRTATPAATRRTEPSTLEWLHWQGTLAEQLGDWWAALDPTSRQVLLAVVALVVCVGVVSLVMYVTGHLGTGDTDNDDDDSF